MSATGINFKTTLAQHEAALAAFDAAYQELNAAHLAVVTSGRTSLNVETRAALDGVGALLHLDQTTLAARQALLCAQVHAVPVSDYEALVATLHVKLGAYQKAREALNAARKTLDAVLERAEASAKETCHLLQEAIEAGKAKK